MRAKQSSYRSFLLDKNDMNSGLMRGLQVLNRDLKLIFATNVVGSFGDGLFAFLLPVYMNNTLGFDSIQIGILYALLALASALTLLISGKLADNYDRRKIMVAGWIAWLPAPLIFAFARNFAEMIPGMVMWGFWLGQPAGSAYIVTSSERDRLTSTFTIMSAGWSSGYTFSPAIGGFLAGTVGMKTVFFLAFIFYASACFTLSFIRSQHANREQGASDGKEYSFSKLIRNRKLLSFSTFFATVMFITMMFRNFVPIYVKRVYGLTDFEVGFLGSILFASSAVLGILLGRLGDMKRKVYPLALSLIFGALGLMLMLWLGSFVILAVSFVFNGASYLTWSMLSAIVGPIAPESCRARWIAIPQTLCMLVSFAAPYVGGFLYATSAKYPFIVAAMAMPMLAFLSVKMLKE
jgi:DHA1 family multidrug resistance protein-like MFS transporter